MHLPWHSIEKKILTDTLPLSVFYSLSTIPVFFESRVQLFKTGWALACGVAFIAYLVRRMNAAHFATIHRLLKNTLLEVMFFCLYPHPITVFFILLSLLVRNVASNFMARSEKSECSRSALLLDLGINPDLPQEHSFPWFRTVLCLGLSLIVIVFLSAFPEWRNAVVWLPFSAFAASILSVLPLRKKIKS